MSSHHASRLATLALLAGGLFSAACGVSDNTSPVAPPTAATPADVNGGSTGSATGGGASGGAGRDSTGSGGSGSRSIAQWEEAEKRRVAEEQLRQQQRYDSLKVVWQQVLDDESGSWDDVLVCDPIQYVATVKVVGPQGADIDFGPHKLRIPAGALSAPTVITAEAPTSLQVLARFSPHGTVFATGRHPTLELSYKHCRNPPGHTARIGYLGADGQIIEWPPSQDFPAEALVRGLIGHFSSYIVAY